MAILALWFPESFVEPPELQADFTILVSGRAGEPICVGKSQMIAIPAPQPKALEGHDASCPSGNSPSGRRKPVALVRKRPRSPARSKV